jgi:pimeloyl-ACP methyl ester carboxylesterase
MQRERQTDTTAVLVHAAWADGSSWNEVTTRLEAEGFRVVAAQIPLTSLSDDVDAVKRVLRRQGGRVVLVGHSYGGAVITAAAADHPNVHALIYVAAIVPDEGETVGQVFERKRAHPKAPALQPDQDGFLWLTVDAFRSAVAPDATEGNKSYGSESEANRLEIPWRTDGTSGMEAKAFLVSDRGKRPHGFTENPALSRRAHAFHNCFAPSGSLSCAFRARGCFQTHPRRGKERGRKLFYEELVV